MGWGICPNATQMTQSYGCTSYDKEWAVPSQVCSSGHFHTGVDLGCDINDPVITPRSGVVTAVGLPYLGDQAVGIKFSDGNFGVFGHLEKALVAVGDQVNAGATIGLAGTRGRSSGVHLHFAVRDDEATEAQPPAHCVDPTPYLTVQEDLDLDSDQNSALIGARDNATAAYVVGQQVHDDTQKLLASFALILPDVQKDWHAALDELRSGGQEVVDAANALPDGPGKDRMLKAIEDLKVKAGPAAAILGG